jgi:hemoglobin
MQTLFEQLGGEDVVRRLVDAFYDHMDTLAEAEVVRAMHPPDLSESRDRLFWFLCGWTGGPQHYIERRGHPRLRRRHMPFPIDDDAASQWMLCMDRALSDVGVEGDVQQKMSSALRHIAAHMRNRGGGPNPGLPIT